MISPIESTIQNQASSIKTGCSSSTGAGPEDYEFVGRHLIASYVGCDQARLRNREGLLQAMQEAVKAAGATLLKMSDHVFPGDGLTAMLLLSESHASIHTYPEHGACFVDLFTCGNSCIAENFDRIMREYLCPSEAHQHILLRSGQMSENLLGERLCSAD